MNAALSLSEHPASRRRGSALVFAVFVTVLMLGCVAFAVDLGYMKVINSDVQSATDAASLAGANALPDGPSAVQDAVEQYLAYNGFDAESLAASGAGTIAVEVGTWDSTARQFTATGDYTTANAVRVSTQRSDVSAFFGQIFGKTSYTVGVGAVALKTGAPMDIMMVLDLSGSMGSEGRIQALRNSAPRFVDVIEDLDGDDQIGVMGLSADPNTYNPAAQGHSGRVYQPAGLVQPAGTHVAVIESDLTTDFAALRASVLTSSNLTAGKYGGGTGIGATIRDATYYLMNEPQARSTAQKVIVLMSDGQATRPSSGASSYALSQANVAKSQKVIVHTISLGNEADVDLMVQIASITGGTHFNATGAGFPSLTDSLTAAFEAAAAAGRHPRMVR
jgi:Flp pilus assembly protein TadG